MGQIKAGIALRNMVEAFPIIQWIMIDTSENSAYIYPGPSTRHTDTNVSNASGALVPTTPNATSIKISGTSTKPDLQDSLATQAEQLLAKVSPCSYQEWQVSMAATFVLDSKLLTNWASHY